MALRKTTMRKKKTVSQQSGGMNPLLVALGAAGAGAAGGAAMGRRAANKTKARIPGAAARVAGKATERFNRANSVAADYARYERNAEDKAYSGRTGRDESEFQRRMAREYRVNKEANQKIASDVESGGRMDPAKTRKIINRKLGRAPEVALKRTRKYTGRGAAAGGALAVLAQLVAAEMSKKK